MQSIQLLSDGAVCYAPHMSHPSDHEQGVVTSRDFTTSTAGLMYVRTLDISRLACAGKAPRN